MFSMNTQPSRFFEIKINTLVGTSLAVQRLRLTASNAGGIGSVPGWETKIPYTLWRGQEEKKILESDLRLNQNL